MEIVRLENGNVELRDGGVLVWSMPKIPTEIKPIDKQGEDHVKLFQSDGRLEYLNLSDITETQLLPVYDLASLLSSSFFVQPSSTAAENNIEIGNTPPTDTNKIWFNSSDNLFYFYDGSAWVSEQLFEVTFNDQGNTPNNTFFRVGNTITNDLGIGYVLEIDARIIGLSFARLPGTAALGNYWLYSNSVTGTDVASVVGVFTVDASARGYVGPNTPTDINAGSYVNIRWNGAQTNNNIVSLKYRKKYV